jgi:hypothetical protein
MKCALRGIQRELAQARGRRPRPGRTPHGSRRRAMRRAQGRSDTDLSFPPTEI